jgi:hypothetical protein
VASPGAAPSSGGFCGGSTDSGDQIGYLPMKLGSGGARGGSRRGEEANGVQN